MPALRVEKLKPTSRQYPERAESRIWGEILFDITVCSKDACGFHSYLSVLSGKPLVEAEKPRDSSRKIVEQLQRSIRVSQYAFARALDPQSGERRPVIPGSSVKGNIRARIELSAFPVNGIVKSCFSVVGGRMISEVHQKIYEAAGMQRERCSYLYDQKVCRVCDIFGSAGLASRVEFSDAYLVKGRVGEVWAGKLRVEAAHPGTVFSGSIYVNGLTPLEVGVLVFGMSVKRVAEPGKPVLFGRFKYRPPPNSNLEFGKIFYTVRGFKPAPYSPISEDDLREKLEEWVDEAKRELNLREIDEVARLIRIQGGEGP